MKCNTFDGRHTPHNATQKWMAKHVTESYVYTCLHFIESFIDGKNVLMLHKKKFQKSASTSLYFFIIKRCSSCITCKSVVKVYLLSERQKIACHESFFCLHFSGFKWSKQASMHRIVLKLTWKVMCDVDLRFSVKWIEWRKYCEMNWTLNFGENLVNIHCTCTSTTTTRLLPNKKNFCGFLFIFCANKWETSLCQMQNSIKKFPIVYKLYRSLYLSTIIYYSHSKASLKKLLFHKDTLVACVGWMK